MITQHIDDFFRIKEAAYIPDMPLLNAHWQQFQVQLQAVPPTPPALPGAGGIIKIIGGLLLAGAVTVAVLNKSNHTPASIPAATPSKQSLQDTNPPVKAITPVTDTIPAVKAVPVREAAKPARAARRVAPIRDTVQRAVQSRVTDTAIRAVPATRRRISTRPATVTDTAARSVRDTLQVREVPRNVYSRAVKPAEGLPIQVAREFVIRNTNAAWPATNTQVLLQAAQPVRVNQQVLEIRPAGAQIKKEQQIIITDTTIIIHP